MILLKTYTYNHEVIVDTALLEENGIRYYIKDEFTVYANSLYSNALGGIKLFVYKDDLERAATLLQIHDTFELKRCPSCDSASVKQTLKSTILYSITALLFFTIPPFRIRYYCRTCGTYFYLFYFFIVFFTI